MASSELNKIVVVLLSWLQLFCLFHQSMSDPVAAPPSESIPAFITRKLAYPDFKDEEKTEAITLLGSAAVDRRSGTVRIPGVINGSSPRDFANQAGRALYSFPFRMMDPETKATSSFHTTFSFRIDKMEPGSHELSDSGLTFLIVPDELTVGRNGGWLGMMNDACDESYKPFAVEFDTFKNDEFQDPNAHHVGINVGSVVSHVTADAHSAGVFFHNGSNLRAWISYNSARHTVDVRVANDGAPKPLNALISANLDLSNIFKEYMFVGFSGSTGSTAQVHSILSWHFSSDSTGVLRFPKDETCATRLVSNLVKKNRTPGAFIIFCLVILLAALAAVNLVFSTRKPRDGTRLSTKLLLAKGRPRPLHQPRRFSLSEILEATGFFNQGEVIGFGRHGTFFNGLLVDGSKVAIKRYSQLLSQQVKHSDHKKLSRELEILSRLRHPNLVPVRGWCLDKGELLLIYENMPNGSLDKWLFFSGRTLPWARRFKVVTEIASALAFLHSGSENTVVHKDVKASNVLLDFTFRARLGDFGLNLSHRAQAQVISGAGPNEVTPRSSCVPPELGQVREPTKEMDVYSFGVMVLEIVSGVRAGSGGGGGDVVEWVWSLEEGGRLEEVIDDNLGARNQSRSWVEEAKRVVRTGLLCTQEEARQRPCMEMVIKYLKGEAWVGEEELPLSRRKILATESDHHLQPPRLLACAPLPVFCFRDQQRWLSPATTSPHSSIPSYLYARKSTSLFLDPS